jgi:hypothetical protein
MITDEQFAYRSLFDFGARWSVVRSRVWRAKHLRRSRPRNGMLTALAAAGVMGSSVWGSTAAQIAAFGRRRHY